MISLNTNPLVYKQTMQTGNIDSWQPVYLKNQFYRRLVFPYKIIKQIVDAMFDNLEKSFKYQYIDVKIQKLEKGKNTANGLWHLDSSLNPDYEYENQLFVSGMNRTEFVTNEIAVPYAETAVDFDRNVKSNNLIIETIPDCTIVKFDGRSVHRGVLVAQPETRLLIRLVNTDKKLPQIQ
jgi:hypothetical protein